MKKTKKCSVKKPRLTDKLLKSLATQKGTITYGKLAQKYDTNARAVGQAVRAVAKVSPKLAKLVVYDANTRPKTYAKKTK